MPDEPSPDLIPIRKLPKLWGVSPSTVSRIRNGDSDYLELCDELDIGGVKALTKAQHEAFLSRKAEKSQQAKAEKAKAAQPVKRKVGRPRKASLNTAARP